MEEAHPNPRRQPCCILRNHGIRSVAWFEDAIATYGVPTVVFDVYILVPDLEQATSVLEKNGWQEVHQQKATIGGIDVDLAQFPQKRLIPSCPLIPKDLTVVLLPNQQWHFDLGADLSREDFIPPLPALVDALIDTVLDCPDNILLRYLSVQLSCLYGHASALRHKAFAEELRYDHRQYHLDICAGMNFGWLQFYAHQRDVRDALRQGKRELMECSAPRSNEDLFTAAREARLLASLPPPPSYDDDENEGEEDEVLS